MGWNKMKRVRNPFEVMSKAKRKAEVKRFYSVLKDAHKLGALEDRPTLQDAKAQFHKMKSEAWWANDLYQACVDVQENGWVHISLKRNDRGTYISWQHKQWIKNDIVGEDKNAMEMFPAEDRVVNCANQYHLWVHKELAHIGFPIGYVTDKPYGKAQQTLETRDNVPNPPNQGKS